MRQGAREGMGKLLACDQVLLGYVVEAPHGSQSLSVTQASKSHGMLFDFETLKCQDSRVKGGEGLLGHGRLDLGVHGMQQACKELPDVHAACRGCGCIIKETRRPRQARDGAGVVAGLVFKKVWLASSQVL